MAEVRNCPKCNEFFNYTGVREVCHKCAQSEEELYQIVYRFLRKRENRAATVERIVEATGAEEELLYRWVRKGRLQPAMFPNLGYPCDNCGLLKRLRNSEIVLSNATVSHITQIENVNN